MNIYIFKIIVVVEINYFTVQYIYTSIKYKTIYNSVQKVKPRGGEEENALFVPQHIYIILMVR